MLGAAEALRIYRRSKRELEESLEPLIGKRLARALAVASCEKGREILEAELLPPGVWGDLAALETIKWEAAVRPPIPSPAVNYTIAAAVTVCAAEKGIPVSVDELEKMLEEPEEELLY